MAGSASLALAERLAQALGTRVATGEFRRFPDGEGYARLDPIEGEAFVVQSTLPDANLVELLLLQDAAREAGASRVTTIVPYFAYARQDQSFKPGEGVSARAVARAISSGCDRVILVDPHKEAIADFFTVPVTSVSAVPQLAKRLADWGVDAILAPDKGARDRATRAAEAIGVPCDHLEKTRLSATEVRIATKELDVEGKRVAIVDDMIASGGTMIKAAEQLKAQGASSVIAACTHGLFTGGAVPRLLAQFERVLCTDTLEAECDAVSCAEAIADALRVPA